MSKRSAKYVSTELSNMTRNRRQRAGNEATGCFASCTAKSLFALTLVLLLGAGIAIGIIFYPQTEVKDQSPTTDEMPSDDDILELQTSEQDGINGNLVDNSQRKMVGLNAVTCGSVQSSASHTLYQRFRFDDLMSKLKGTRSVPNSAYKRYAKIVGGKEVTIKNHPWQVALWTEKLGHTCGGSLIASKWVLSAAHCTVVFNKPSDWTIYIGETKRNNMDFLISEEGLQHILATHVISHENFNHYNYVNDVSLIRLAQHAVLNEFTNTICLPSLNAPLPNGTKCIVSGWGVTVEHGSTPEKLQEASVDIIDRSICNAETWLMGMVTDKMVCAGTVDGSQDACQGDSGGPLVCVIPNSDVLQLVGAVSWGIGCGVRFMPGVYTDLRKYVVWISSTMNAIDQAMN